MNDESRPKAALESLAGATGASVTRPSHDSAQGALMGLDLAIANTDEWWHSVAMRAMRWLAEAPGEFDAYDLTLLGVPAPDHPNRWGALFRAAHTAGVIEPAGYTQSRRPGRAGGCCRVWRGATR